eukprot:g681.t1
MTQIHKSKDDHILTVTTKTCWNTIHCILVTFAVGALVAKAPPVVWVSILVGFFLVLNIMRYVMNNEIRYFHRMELSKFGTVIFTIIVLIGYTFGVGLMPLSNFRFQNLLGPTIYAIGWISAFLISCISLLCFTSNVYLRVGFACLSFFYIVVICIYFRQLKPGAWRTFVLSNGNWKDTLRNEFWENTYDSEIWDDITLIGDKDANYAAMVLKYLNTDLPWDLLTDWLKEKKRTTFQVNLPTWLTIEWLALVPEHVKVKVWKPVEYRDLLRRIRIVESQFASFRNDESRNMPMILQREDTDDEDEKTSDATNDEQKAPGTGTLEMRNINAEKENNQTTRKKLMTNINKRKSSFTGSMSELPLIQTSKEDDVPLALKKLLEEAERLSFDKIIQVSKEAIDKELFDILLGPDGKATGKDIMFIICKGFLKQMHKLKLKAHFSEGVTRVLMVAFFEFLDEVSDIVLAIIFAYDSNNRGWAAILMFVFMGLYRFVSFLMSISVKEAFLRNCEALIGIKVITDTYRLVKHGKNAKTGEIDLLTMRFVTLGTGLAFESLPQMMLQLIIVMSDMKN